MNYSDAMNWALQEALLGRRPNITVAPYLGDQIAGTSISPNEWRDENGAKIAMVVVKGPIEYDNWRMLADGEPIHVWPGSGSVSLPEGMSIDTTLVFYVDSTVGDQ